jgi:hypothetical protein
MPTTEYGKRFIEVYQQNIHREGAEELLSWLTGKTAAESGNLFQGSELSAKASDFFKAPASTRFHLDCEGGLVRHSLNVWKELKRLCEAYKDVVQVTEETVAICALLHDVCKVNSYSISWRNVKNEATGVWEKKPYYTKNELFNYGGHGAKSVYLIQKYMPLRDEEAVAIQNHMGLYNKPSNDFSLAAAFSQYPLAWLLHVADEAATYIDEKEQ